MTEDDDAAAPSKFDATAYGSYGSYFSGTFGMVDKSVPRDECGCNEGGGKTADS